MKAQDQPRASIIIIAYNAGRTIEQAVQSACEQSEKRIEILCVDDGSTDATADRVRRLAARDPRIQMIAQPHGGPLAARYTGVQHATGGWTMFLDADDLLSPIAVRTACDAAEEVGADVLEFGVEMVKNSDCPPSDAYWNWLERFFSQQKPLPKKVCGPEMINACFDGMAFPHNVWNKLYRTDLLRAALGEYRGERLGFWEDLLITLMVLCHMERYARIPTKLYTYTIGGGMTTTPAHGVSADALRSNGIEWLALKLAREWLDKIGYPQDEIAPAMAAITRNIQESVCSSLTERYSPDARREYLMGLAEICTREEYAELVALCIDRQQTLLERSAQEDRQLRESMARIQAHADQLKAQNIALKESFDTISNAFFWRITKPLRVMLDALKKVLRSDTRM